MRGVLLAAVLLSFTLGTAAEQDAEAAVAAVLDDLHAAASEADGDRYFSHFTFDSVFLGTDATERWSKGEFQAFAEPYFSQGKGWTYHVRERHVSLAEPIAWFDEVLDNDSYGECRGTGVLRKTPEGWKIEQYNLTIPIPNELAKDVVAKIKAGSQSSSGTEAQ